MGAARKQTLRRTATRPAPAAAPRPRTVGSRTATVLSVRESLGLSRKLFARLSGVSERLLADLEPRRIADLAPGQARRMVEMQRLAGALAEVARPAFLSRWVCAPNDALGGLSPLETVERGQSDRLWALLFHLRGGLPT